MTLAEDYPYADRGAVRRRPFGRLMERDIDSMQEIAGRRLHRQSAHPGRVQDRAGVGAAGIAQSTRSRHSHPRRRVSDEW